MKLIYLLLLPLLVVANSPCSAQSGNLPAENWCIQKATDQAGGLVFITANRGYQDYAHKAEFPWCLAVNITTRNKNPNGHPTPPEATVLNETEDGITAALQQVGLAHLVGRTTVNGYRELYYYVADPEKVNAALTRLTKKKQPRPWEYHMAEDQTWQRVAPFFAGTPACL
ncbi:DUF695 domain-containing protein [Hymenobacter arizonensis]|uniref:DUF695 domain-containing protein n=1 Tax=Hymenobacter arizonensis TaxID=1227077 RepID=A0A1I6BMT3_HYMAR|nr:DUF695 domain-containing protein [Hymenobacter arizonensis]SFQ82221.1 Family of unknown function [Hymenobacter arizonensis]